VLWLVSSQRDAAVKVGAALRACLPDEFRGNVTGWLAALAEDIGVSDRAVENWYYGKNAPDAEALIKLIQHPEIGRAFFNALFADAGLVTVRANEHGPVKPAFDLDRVGPDQARAVAKWIELWAAGEDLRRGPQSKAG